MNTNTLLTNYPSNSFDVISSKRERVRVQCCFTLTETVRTIRDWEPRTATSTFTRLLSYCRVKKRTHFHHRFKDACTPGKQVVFATFVFEMAPYPHRRRKINRFTVWRDKINIQTSFLSKQHSCLADSMF